MANSTTKERIARLEAQREDWEKAWRHFLTNDWLHLKNKVDGVVKGQKWIIGLLITTLITISVGLGFIILK